MRKNNCYKKILMLLTGLTSTCCCSAMEKNPEKPKSKTSADVRKRKALTPKKSKSTALVDVLKRKGLGLELNPEQQMEFDKKFGLIDPRKTKGDIIPTKQLIDEIFKNKVSELYFRSCRNHEDNINKKVKGLSWRDPEFNKSLWKAVHMIKVQTKQGETVLVADNPLSCETSAKLGAWNCRSTASAWKQFLQDECVPVGILHMPNHVEAISLFRNPKTNKITPMLLALDPKIGFDLSSYYSTVPAAYGDHAFYSPFQCLITTCQNPNFAYSVPLWTLEICAQSNLKTADSNNGLRVLAEAEAAQLKNEILDGLRDIIKNRTMVCMPYGRYEYQPYQFGFVVYEMDLEGVRFKGNKTLNKGIKLKSYIISAEQAEMYNIRLNSKWEDVKKHFMCCGEEGCVLPEDINLWPKNLVTFCP